MNDVAEGKEEVPSRDRVRTSKVYYATDGKQFDSMAEAVEHQTKIDKLDKVKEFVDRTVTDDVYFDGDANRIALDAEDVVNYLIDHRIDLLKLLA